MKTLPGPAAQLIDFGYAVKLPLSEAIDEVYGLEKSSVCSFSGFLHVCYNLRRPYFVMADRAFTALWPDTS